MTRATASDADAARQDRPRDPVGPSIELGIREGVRSELDGQPIRVGRNLSSKALRNALLDRGALEGDEALGRRQGDHEPGRYHPPDPADDLARERGLVLAEAVPGARHHDPRERPAAAH